MKRINLIPSGSRKLAKIANTQGRKIVTSIVVLLVLLYVWHATAILRYRFTIDAYKNQLSDLQVKLSESQHTYERFIERRESIDNERSAVAKRLNLLRESRRTGFIWSKVLLATSELLSKEIWIRNISLDKDELVIGGSSPNNTLVSHLMGKLDESPYFQNTTFKYMQKNLKSEKTIIDFEVKTQIKLDKVRKSK